MRLSVYLSVVLATVSVTPSQGTSRALRLAVISPNGTLRDLEQTSHPSNSHVIEHDPTTTGSKDCCKDTDAEVESDDEWRLPKDVIPLHYDLHLDVDMEAYKFHGTVQITVNVQKPTNRITLHSDALKIIGLPEISYELRGLKKRKVGWYKVLSFKEDKKYTTLTLKLNDNLESGKSYLLKIDFKGEIREDEPGFYTTPYTVGNKTRWSAITHFQPTYARQTFPCFDEPNLKAEFDITVTHDLKYSAYSNMPIQKSERKNNRVTDKFQRTKKMSTYSIAFIVTDFEYAKTNDSISSVYADEKFIKDAEYSLKIGVNALREMERFTNISFSLPKITHVAIPRFSYDSSENWGLIMYGDREMIPMNDSGTIVQKLIPKTITHEISHQWFGDLVSVDWWSYAWMKEGFATFFENYITEKITEGEFSLWNEFISGSFQFALELDENPSTAVALTSKVSTPEEIIDKFRGIAHHKGGAVLRMFAEVLTIEKFRDGLRHYLTKKQYSSATPDDLFVEWEKVSSKALPQDLKFTDFAKSWTEQGGVPVVNAIRNYDTGEVTFTQQRFFDKKPECPCDYNRRWWIPLTWISQNKKPTVLRFEPKAWLRGDVEDEKLVRKIDTAPNEWLLVNFDSIGYFRVNYDTKNWQLLTKALTTNPPQLPTQYRAQLINDAFFLASSNNLDFKVALDTLIVLSNESTTTVWQSAFRILTKLVDELGSTEAYPMLEEYGRNIFTGVYSTLGFQRHHQEKYAKSFLRPFISYWACFFGVTQCVKDATEYFRNHKNNVCGIHPDILSATFCGATRGADKETFRGIRETVEQASQTSLKIITDWLITCQPDDKIIKWHLEEALQEDSVIPKSMTKTIIEQVLIPSRFSVGFDFIKKNLDEMLSRLGKNDTSSLVVKLIHSLRLESDYEEVRDWLNSNAHKLHNSENLIAELTASKSNTEWNILHFSEVTRWLSTTLGHNPTSDQPLPPTELHLKPTDRAGVRIIGRRGPARRPQSGLGRRQRRPP